MDALLTGPILTTALPEFFRRENKRGMTLVLAPPEERDAIVPGIPVYTAVVQSRNYTFQLPDDHYYCCEVDGVDYILAGTCAVEIKPGDYHGQFTHEGKEVRTTVTYTREATGERRDCGKCGAVAVVGLRRRHRVTREDETLHDETMWVPPL
jgi:hypothetical protein